MEIQKEEAKKGDNPSLIGLLDNEINALKYSATILEDSVKPIDSLIVDVEKMRSKIKSLAVSHQKYPASPGYQKAHSDLLKEIHNFSKNESHNKIAMGSNVRTMRSVLSEPLDDGLQQSLLFADTQEQEKSCMFYNNSLLNILRLSYTEALSQIIKLAPSVKSNFAPKTTDGDRAGLGPEFETVELTPAEGTTPSTHITATGLAEKGINSTPGDGRSKVVELDAYRQRAKKPPPDNGIDPGRGMG